MAEVRYKIACEFKISETHCHNHQRQRQYNYTYMINKHWKNKSKLKYLIKNKVKKLLDLRERRNNEEENFHKYMYVVGGRNLQE